MKTYNKSVMTLGINRIAHAYTIASFLLGSLVSIMANGQGAEVTMTPSYVEVSVDEIFEVDIQINPGGQALAVADVHLQFDPSFLEVLEVEILDAGEFNVLPASINNISGSLSVNSFQLGDESIVPAFPLVRIKMRALAETQGTIVSHPQDVFPRTILAFAGNELNTFHTPLEVTIAGADPLSTYSENVDGLSMSVWPNPSQGTSTVEFIIAKGGTATLEVFDVSGLSVMRVFHGRTPSATSMLFDLNMHKLADGIYFLRLITDQGTLVQRIALTK